VTSFFQKILGKSQPKPGDAVTKPLSPKAGDQPSLEVAPGESIPEIPQLVASWGQSVGQQREHNEDALFTLTSTLSSDIRQIPFGLYIVADGMGGHQHGEIASAMAIRVMASHIIRKLYLPFFSLSAGVPEQSVQEIMQEGVLEAHRAILKQALGGGTTMTAGLIVGEQITIAHIGDSRAYAVYPDGKMEILTRDHSLVKRLEELGQITPEEAAIHPQRNVLYRALGQGEPFDPDIITAPVPLKGYLLLCSDGLWGAVSEEEMFKTITSTPSLQKSCQKLVEAANKAGGPDNISVILARMPS
jgi:serine/threonine protein phosphatase PrpC